MEPQSHWTEAAWWDRSCRCKLSAFKNNKHKGYLHEFEMQPQHVQAESPNIQIQSCVDTFAHCSSTVHVALYAAREMLMDLTVVRTSS